jgi:DNA-binding IclR family transcriptional regulator
MERKRFDIQRVSGMSVSDEELLADLRCVAANLRKATVGQKSIVGSGGTTTRLQAGASEHGTTPCGPPD